MIPGRLIGGPYDGSMLTPARRPNFVWVGGSAANPRAYREPKGNRQLYRLYGVAGESEPFLFAGHTHRKCGGCGAYIESRPDQCGLCGATSEASLPH